LTQSKRNAHENDVSIILRPAHFSKSSDQLFTRLVFHHALMPGPAGKRRSLATFARVANHQCPMKSPGLSSRTHYVAPRKTLMLAIAFCLLFAGVGLYQVILSVSNWTWRSVDCVVKEFRLQDDADRDPPFYAEVIFEFKWNGHVYRSDDLGIDGWKNAENGLVLQRELEQKQFAAKAYLPTGDPNHAVLLRPEPRWAGMAFVLFGASFTWLLIMADRYRDAKSDILSRKTTPALALMFGGVGIFMLVTLSIPTWIEQTRILAWQEIPATIVWSKVRVQRGSRNTTHRPDICYEYIADNHIWRNNRLAPGIVSTHADSAHDLVGQYPAGKRTTCRIHPSDPAKTYLTPKTSWQILFTLFPLPFLCVGYLCLRSLLKKS
jgi:hypothetical protein